MINYTGYAKQFKLMYVYKDMHTIVLVVLKLHK